MKLKTWFHFDCSFNKLKQLCFGIVDFPVVLFNMQYKVVLDFESVDEILSITIQ